MICITAPFLFLELVFVVFAAEELTLRTELANLAVESKVTMTRSMAWRVIFLREKDIKC